MIFQTRAGDYRKMGTEQCADGVTFTFQCPKELACAVVLFEKKTGKQAAKIDVLPQYRVGSVRSVTIYPLKAEKYYYCYEIEGKRVRDPYGERVIGREKWGDTERTLDDALLSGFKKEGFDWSEDVSVEIPANEMVMYKLHVRGFSMDGRGRNKGTFAAVMDRLSYLKELGITTLECMPVYEFEELMENGRLNYWGYAPSDYFAVKSSYASQKDADWEFIVKMMIIMRDLMTGNPKLKEMGFKEEALGHNAIAAGFQGQRQWTDFYPNGDYPEALLNTSFDWNGIREAFVVATENDACNGVAMLFGHLLTNRAQIFSDVRTYWSPEAVKRVTGKELSGLAANGIIHLINSGATTLDGSGQSRRGRQSGDERTLEPD